MNESELIDDLIVRSQIAINDANILSDLLIYDEIIEKYNDEVSSVKQKLSRFKYYAGLVEELDYIADLKILIQVLQIMKKRIILNEEKAKKLSFILIK